MIKCPECGHVGEDAAEDAMNAAGFCQCEECGHTDEGEEFESVDGD